MISIQEIENYQDFPFEQLESQHSQKCKNKEDREQVTTVNAFSPEINHKTVNKKEPQHDKLDKCCQELPLESKLSKKSSQKEQPKINITWNENEKNQFENYEKMFTKCSQNIFEQKSIKELGESPQANLLLQPDLTMSNKSSNKAVSLDIHLPATQSMVYISQDQSQGCSNTQNKQLSSKKRKTKLKKRTFNQEVPASPPFSHTSPQFNQQRMKSLKKVTFIGDGDSEIIEDEERTNRPKKKSLDCEKQQKSMTSILSYKQKKNKNMQQSRKILSQDHGHSLYRLLSFKKSEEVLMCRSVLIKDDFTEQKQLKIYMLCRQHEHQNIVKMHSFDKVIRQNNKYHVQIKMDYYPKNLDEYLLQAKKSQSIAQIQRKLILFQILKAINFIHSKDICHRDINPYNIMLGDQLETAITNFAYVKDTKKEYSEDHFYECNSYIRPPEVIMEPTRYFQKGGDIWSFGCLIVHMLKGEPAFFKVSDADMVLQMIKILGIPSKQFLDSINFKAWKKFIFPKMCKKSMRQTFKCFQPELLKMLKKIFVYEPSLRPTASTLLCSSYFEQIRQETAYKRLANIYNINNLFTFGTGELTRQERQKIVPDWY